MKNKKRIAYVIIGIFVIIIAVFIFKKNNVNNQTITIKTSDFIDQVSVSGKVVASNNVDLGFKDSGRITDVYFSVGQKVKKGQTISSLDSIDAKGSLDVAKANYQKVLNGATSSDVNVAKAALETAQVALDQTKEQQSILIKNAKKNLLNSGFIVTTEDSQSTQTPPIVSGTYLKENEGQIIITEYDSSGGSSFNTSGLVEASGMVSTEVPQPIGGTGLYIKFFSTIDKTKWILNIPNTQSSLYLQNYNAYQSALSTQIQTIANATALLDQAKSALLLKVANARPEDIASANGSLLIAENAYNNKFILAPFDGIITKVDAKVGEIASPNTPLITMMSVGTFQIESYVPEINIAKIKLDDETNVTLDAYGDSVVFKARVVSIDPAETIRDGVSTYKIKLQFEEKDDRVKSGMTANVSVNTYSKQNAIIVPGGVIFDKDGKKFVQVQEGKNILDREIVIGNISSLNQVEVVSGLKNGDMVLLNPLNLPVK